MGGDAALCRKYHQMVGGDGDSDFLPGGVVRMAGEDRHQLIAGGQLQPVQRRRAEEGLAYDKRPQRAVRLVDDVIRAQPVRLHRFTQGNRY